MDDVAPDRQPPSLLGGGLADASDGLPTADATAPRPRTGERGAVAVAIALLVAVLLPLGLLVRAGWTPLLDLDAATSDALVVPGRGGEVDLLRVLTAPGLVAARAIVLLPLAVWFAMLRRWQLLAYVAVAGIGVSPVNRLLKSVFDRERPSFDDTIAMGGQSFPSGHSSGAAALATVLVVVAWPVLAGTWRRVWVVLAGLGMIMVGYTRLALGAHYLSDVVAGWSLGVAWALLLAVVLGVWPAAVGALGSRSEGAP